MDFAVFESGKQTKFMELVRINSQKKWEELAKEANKSKSSICFYYYEKQKIPFNIAKEWSNKYKIKLENKDIIKIENQPKPIKKPNLSRRYAEFIGALSGDGHLHKKPAELSITCNKKFDR